MHTGIKLPPDYVLVVASSHRQRDRCACIFGGVSVRVNPAGDRSYLACSKSGYAIPAKELESALRIKGVRQIKRQRHLMFWGGWGASNHGQRAKAISLGFIELEENCG